MFKELSNEFSVGQYFVTCNCDLSNESQTINAWGEHSLKAYFRTTVRVHMLSHSRGHILPFWPFYQESEGGCFFFQLSSSFTNMAGTRKALFGEGKRR